MSQVILRGQKAGGGNVQSRGAQITKVAGPAYYNSGLTVFISVLLSLNQLLSPDYRHIPVLQAGPLNERLDVSFNWELPVSFSRIRVNHTWYLGIPAEVMNTVHRPRPLQCSLALTCIIALQNTIWNLDHGQNFAHSLRFELRSNQIEKRRKNTAYTAPASTSHIIHHLAAGPKNN